MFKVGYGSEKHLGCIGSYLMLGWPFEVYEKPTSYSLGRHHVKS